MERVAFLVDSTGERIDCLINPETLVIRRLAGVRQAALPGAAVGSGQDDLMMFTGGGRTELVLDLLFDVDLADSAHRPSDVRALTGKLWSLSENAEGRPPQVRLVWGKRWNLPGVIVSVAERLDAIDSDGTPRRSWMRLKMVRTKEEPVSGPARTNQNAVQAVGPAGRFDLLATEALGDPSRWRELAEHNDVADPLGLSSGAVLGVP